MKAACLRYLSGLLGLAISATWCGTADAATLILGAGDQAISIGATTMSRYDEDNLEFNDFIPPP
ncbi:MAG: hypothetical protein F6K00_22435 [Leptolyngbya sp. SIOISBB]|nr:hypothetical protein [Leptolyngbya sp. SIOISBB]